MELKPTECRSCDQSIVWLKTYAGKNIPVDTESLDSTDDSETIFDRKRHISHFSTCPDADQHRHPRGPATAGWKFVSLIIGNTTLDLAVSGDRMRIRDGGPRSPDWPRVKTREIHLAETLEKRTRLIITEREAGVEPASGD